MKKLALSILKSFCQSSLFDKSTTKKNVHVLFCLPLRYISLYATRTGSFPWISSSKSQNAIYKSLRGPGQRSSYPRKIIVVQFMFCDHTNSNGFRINLSIIISSFRVIKGWLNMYFEATVWNNEEILELLKCQKTLSMSRLLNNCQITEKCQAGKKNDFGRKLVDVRKDML